jgi:iron(III) transport system substrate-binding protein
MADTYGQAPAKQLSRVLALAATLTIVISGCTGNNDTPGEHPAGDKNPVTSDGRPGGTLTVYSRDRDLAEPLFEQFERRTGIQIRARWGDPIELADQIIADRGSSPADVYYGPLSDALGSLSESGRLAKLSDRQIRQVPPAYRSPDGTWVGTAGRAHVVYYNTDQFMAADLPDSILGFNDPAWRDHIAWDPTSRSLRDVVTEIRALKGENAAQRWLNGIEANRPTTIRGAEAIIDVVSKGEIADVGFGSHSYLYEMHADGEALNVGAKFYRGNEPGGLLNMGGVGIIKGTDNPAAANALVDFLLSRQAQQYMVKDSYEIPVIKNVKLPKGIPSAKQLVVPGLDARKFEELPDADRLLTNTGVIR